MGLEKIFLKVHNSIRQFFSSRTFALAYFVLVSFHGISQDVKSNVLNGFGTTVLTQEITFDASVGELAVSTFKAEGVSLTQGFLQPISLKTPCGNVVLQAFPNPVLSGIRVYAEGCDVEISFIKTYDLFGKLVLEGKPVDNQIDFSSIGVGVYLVRAYNLNDQVIGVVKIVKATI